MVAIGSVSRCSDSSLVHSRWIEKVVTYPRHHFRQDGVQIQSYRRWQPRHCDFCNQLCEQDLWTHSVHALSRNGPIPRRYNRPALEEAYTNHHKEPDQAHTAYDIDEVSEWLDGEHTTVELQDGNLHDCDR
ncbi:MAG: hypothetical protein Q9187_006034 [Circinaria calcarea]